MTEHKLLRSQLHCISPKKMGAFLWTEYRWKTIGRKHDFGDAVTMCFALAGAFGISAGGYTPIKKRRHIRYVLK